LIQGLHYVTEYLDHDTHDRLLAAVDAQPWLTSVDRGVQIYGYTYVHAKRAILRIGELPVWSQELAARLQRDGLMPALPDQLVVNDYQPGCGIFRHLDVDVLGDVVVSVSLGSTCVMQFTHMESGRQEQLLLEPRSVLVLTGEARWAWQHEIPPRLADTWQNRELPRARRVSLTFRLMPGLSPQPA
jgi:alkylated DNA repair dioxygenase AlkB